MTKSVNIDDFIALKEEKIIKRHDYLMRTLDIFKSKNTAIFNESLEYTLGDIADTALTLNSAYWLRFQSIFYPYVQAPDGGHTNIRYEKIISALELTVIEQQPFSLQNSINQFRINAKYALYLSTCFLCAWEKIDIIKYNSILESDKKIAEIIANHEKWLTNLDPQFEYPVFINAQFWDVYIELIKRIAGL